MSEDILDSILRARQNSPDLDAIAKEAGIRPAFFRSIIQAESAGKPDVVSPKGALGLGQLMPGTAKDMGVNDAFDPTDNAKGSARYLRQLLDKYNGDEKLAAAAYNAGPGNVDKYGGVPPFKETQNYVSKVAPADGTPDILASILAARQQQQPSFGQALARDTAEQASNLGNTILHPIVSAEGMGRAIAGGYQRLADLAGIPTGAVDRFIGNHRADADALHDTYANEYGSLGAIKNSVLQHPVRTAMDISGALSGAGDLLDAGNLAANSSRVARAAELARTAAKFTDPVQAGAATAGSVLSHTVQPVANAMARKIVNVNMRIPKAMIHAENRVGGVPHADAVLNVGRNTNPFTRTSLGGQLNTENVIKRLSAEQQALRDADVARGSVYNPGVIDRAIASQADFWRHDPTYSQTALNTINNARENLLNNDQYAKDRIVQVPVQTQVQVPHPTAVDAMGNPIMQTQPTVTMQPQVVGRDFKPVDANQLEAAKQPIYTRQEDNYGPGRDSVKDSVDKAAASAADSLLDANIPGYDKLSKQKQEAVVAKKALMDADERRKTKQPFQLLTDAATSTLPILWGEGAHGLALAGAGLVSGLAATRAMMYHPWLASPTAAALWAAGHFPRSPISQALLTTAERSVLPTAQVNQGVQNGLRPVTKDEFQPAYSGYITARPKDDEQ